MKPHNLMKGLAFMESLAFFFNLPAGAPGPILSEGTGGQHLPLDIAEGKAVESEGKP